MRMDTTIPKATHDWMLGTPKFKIWITGNPLTEREYSKARLINPAVKSVITRVSDQTDSRLTIVLTRGMFLLLTGLILVSPRSSRVKIIRTHDPKVGMRKS